jgi:hypothetical protein
MKYLIVLMAVVVTACGSFSEQPDMSFEMKTLLRESRQGCDADTAACARFEVSYPAFIEMDSNVQRAIDERVVAMLAGGPPEEPQSIQTLADDFVADFEAFERENPEFGLGWYFDGNVSVLVASDTLISLQVDSETFTGGAHGSFTTRFVNVDPMTGTSYLLDALLVPGYEDELAKLAEEDFLRQRMPESDSTGSEMAIPFKLNDNYGFRKEGIVFFFNDYELGSYAEGSTEILIPYERLGAWMKKGR